MSKRWFRCQLGGEGLASCHIIFLFNAPSFLFLSLFFFQVSEFDLVQETIPVVDKQLLKIDSLVTKSSIPTALLALTRTSTS